MKNTGLTLTDRLGLFYGTICFFVTLPLTIFIGSVPTIFLTSMIQNQVLKLTVNLGVIGIAVLMSFFASVVTGLALSYGLSWAGKKLGVGQALSKVGRPVDTLQKVNYGALAGAGLAVIAFILKGETPIHSVTTRVAHLFPGPLVMSMGDFFSFDLGHIYSAATGFLAVGFLFLIAGIVAGSMTAAAVELTFSRK